MIKILSTFLLIICISVSCNNTSPKAEEETKNEYKKINRQRCSFNLPGSLFLGEIDVSLDEEGYFRIISHRSENRMQLFVFNSKIDVDEKLDNQIEALNTPNVFTAKSIEKENRFGNYQGKGVIMKGIYQGGIVRGTIQIFCFGTGDKGFLVIRQTIKKSDTEAFNLVENSFRMK